jgi:DNA-binding response OmpR family regulator
LVEDEALVAMLVEDLLEAVGFQPQHVDTAADALAALAKGDISLAVIDVGLPDMRGDDLAARVRELAPSMPIILASGYDSVELRRRFQDDAAVTVLGKPYTEHDLREAISATGLPVT